MKKSSEEEEEEDEMEVILCKGCRAIISTGSHLLQQERDVILLNKSSVSICRDVMVSTDPFDKYCTYQQLICRGCRQQIGKIYLALTPGLIFLLDKHVIKKSAVVFEKVYLSGKKSQPSQNNIDPPGKIEIQINVKNYNPFMSEEEVECFGI